MSFLIYLAILLHSLDLLNVYNEQYTPVLSLVKTSLLSSFFVLTFEMIYNNACVMNKETTLWTLTYLVDCQMAGTSVSDWQW